MAGMKLALALIPALLLAPLATAETPEARYRTATALADAGLAKAFRAALDAAEKAGSDDFYAAAKLVVDTTGDPTLMQPLMERAAKEGSAAATTWLALGELQRLHTLGADLGTDARAKALRAQVDAAAAKQYAPALVQASQLAAAGVGAAPDQQLATRYLMEACRLKSSQARAAYLMVSGRLADGDLTRPEIASELAKGNYYLEELLAQMQGDTAKGVEWLRKASAHGSPAAPFVLAGSQAAGLGQEEALEQLTLAADRHFPTAMAYLGAIALRAGLFRTEGLELAQDAEAGLRRLLYAAALGNGVAAHTLATAYGQKEAGPVPPDLIYRLYRLAADQGEPFGMAGCGYCLLTGRGCRQDAKEGEALLRRAADKGANWAHQALASAYFNGFGVKADMFAATNALTEDAQAGSLHAYSTMAALVALGNEAARPDPARAAVYLDLAREKGEPQAQEVYDTIIKAGGWRFMPGLW